MNKQVIANLLELNVDELDKYTKVVDGLNATYYWNPERGGKMMIVGADGSYLMVGSAVGYDELIEEFKQGKRNGKLSPVESFIMRNTNPMDPFWGIVTRKFFSNLNVFEEDILGLLNKFESNKDLYNDFLKEIMQECGKEFDNVEKNVEIFNKYNGR